MLTSVSFLTCCFSPTWLPAVVVARLQAAKRHEIKTWMEAEIKVLSWLRFDPDCVRYIIHHGGLGGSAPEELLAQQEAARRRLHYLSR